MSKHTHRAVCGLLAILILLSAAFFCPTACEAAASEIAPLPSLDDVGAVLFFHIDSGFTLAEKNTAIILPAGPTGKIVAGLIACEVFAARLDEEVVVTQEMIKGSSGYRLWAKETGNILLTVEDLLYAAICGSYNDAFDALGCLIAGDKQEFIRQMNTRATECGAKNTNYADISGILDASVTTAEDTAAIARVAAANPLYTRITATESYRRNGLSIYNRNSLISAHETNLYYNPKCKGMNAGYTNRAGNCAVTLIKSTGGNYICVLLGGREGEDGTNYAYRLTNTLIRWVDTSYTFLEIISPETVVCTLPVTVSDLITEVEIKVKESLFYFLPASTKLGEELTYSIRLDHTTLEAPFPQGMKVGYVAIVYRGKVIGNATLYTASTAERSSFIGNLQAMQDSLKSRAFLAGAICFALLTIAWLLTEYLIIHSRRHRWDKYFSEKLEAPERMARKPRPPRPEQDAQEQRRKR